MNVRDFKFNFIWYYEAGSGSTRPEVWRPVLVRWLVRWNFRVHIRVQRKKLHNLVSGQFSFVFSIISYISDLANWKRLSNCPDTVPFKTYKNENILWSRRRRDQTRTRTRVDLYATSQPVYGYSVWICRSNLVHRVHFGISHFYSLKNTLYYNSFGC